MQANKGAAATIMETAANVAASAKSGLDKTRAVLEEKVEQMSTSDQVERDMATLRKEEKIDLAETRKREAFAQNAAASTGAGAKGYTDGSDIAINSGSPRSKPTTTDYVSPRSKPTTTDYVTEDVVGSPYPIGTTTSVVGSPKTNTTGAGSTTQVMDGVGSEKAPETNTGAAGAWQDPVGNPNTTASGLESSQTNTGTGRASMDGDRKPNSV